MKYYLGIDMGSSSIKASLIDEKGKIVARAKTPVQILNPQKGFFEIDSENTWWKGFKEITRQISETVSIGDVASICISSLCGTFVPVDECLNPLCNAILYSIDTRSQAQVQRLNSQLGEKFLMDRLGGAFTTHSVFPKILWVKENLPDIYSKTKYFVESNNYVSMKLTGQVAWDYPTSFGSQLVNLSSMDMDKELAQQIGIDTQKLPRLNYVTDRLGSVCTEEALELGYSKGAAVMTGGCDINAEAMSIGAVNPGDMLVVYGSTMSTLCTLPKFIPLKGFRTGMSVLKGSYRLGTASSSGARHIQWIDGMIGAPCKVDFDRLPTGILMLPYLDGVRSPFDNPDAVPVVIGMGKDSTLNDLAVSAREALGYEVAMLIHMIEASGVSSSYINCTGGLTHVPELMQIIADITGKPQRLFLSTDASFGDALVAASVEMPVGDLLKLPGVAKEIAPDQIVYPDFARHEAYASLSEKYNGLYEKIKPIFEKQC